MNFWQAHKQVFLVGSVVTLLLLILGTSVYFWAVSAGKISPILTERTPTPTPEPAVQASLTNGVMVASEIAKRHPVAAMIENSPDARPQAGLTSADIVYEAVTEGGITRFMGIFAQTYPTKAGPIRSARSYFIDWLSEYDAFYAHAGGSPTALNRIREYGIKDYPHSNDAYHREPRAGIASEHTLFADLNIIYQNGITKRGWSPTVSFSPWTFKDPSAAPAKTGPITVNFTTGQFSVVWTQDLAKNEYSRVMGGVAHKDQVSGAQITARTIVTMVVERNANAAYKDSGKESEWTMTTIGSGKASVFQDGLRVDGTWKKPSRTERTRFFDANGKEIELNRGKIWIEIMPPTSTVTVAPAA